MVNPHSFAQTVENVFYLSFLVRENKVCIETEDNQESEYYKDVIVCEWWPRREEDEVPPRRS